MQTTGDNHFLYLFCIFCLDDEMHFFLVITSSNVPERSTIQSSFGLSTTDRTSAGTPFLTITYDKSSSKDIYPADKHLFR